MFLHQYNQPRRSRHFDSTREPDAFAGYAPQHNTLRQMTRPDQDEHPFEPDHFGLGHSPFRRSSHASYRRTPPSPIGYRSPYASHSAPGYEQNPYRSSATQTTGADHILRIISQKRELHSQHVESHTSTAGRLNHPNSVTIKSNFTVPRSLQGHKLGLSNPTEVTATRGVIESAVQGHSSTPQEPHQQARALLERQIIYRTVNTGKGTTGVTEMQTGLGEAQDGKAKKLIQHNLPYYRLKGKRNMRFWDLS